MLSRAAQPRADENRTSASAVRVEPLRLIGTPAPDDEWAILLQKRRAEEEEAEWRAQLARVEAALEEEREWTSRMSSVRVDTPSEDDEEAEWSKIMARVRTSTPAIMPVKTPLPQKASQAPTVRQRPGARPAQRVSHPPRVMESAAPLKFSLPGEGSDAKSTIREEITHVKARSQVAREHRASVPAKRELSPIQKRDTSEVKPKREASAPTMRSSAMPLPKRESVPVQKREASRPSEPAPRHSTQPSGRVRAYPNTPHVNAPAKQSERPAQRLTLSPAQRATMPPVEPRPAPAAENVATAAPSQARKSSPGMNSLRVAANKKTASDSGVRNVAVQKHTAPQPVAKKTAPAPQKPVEEKKDSSLVGLSAAIELIEREHQSARPSNVAPPPPPRGSLTPQASVVQTGAPTSHAATSPVRPSTPSGLPALHIPAPPPSRAKLAKMPKPRITVPPPPPPSRSKKDAPKGVVSKVRSVLSALTKPRG